MIDWLENHFPPGSNYLVAQDNVEQLNAYLFNEFVSTRNSGRKQSLWGESAQKLSSLGEKIGWVPNRFFAAFLSDTVEEEIAEAFAASQKLLQFDSTHLELSRGLLTHFDLLYLAERNPNLLSEGEAKLIWFLTQWAKQPLFLIIGYLPVSLSKKWIDDDVFFLKQSAGSENKNITIILGYLPFQIDWLNDLLNDQKWVNIQKMPNRE